jgi:hypothetical protein
MGKGGGRITRHGARIPEEVLQWKITNDLFENLAKKPSYLSIWLNSSKIIKLGQTQKYLL